MRRIVWKPSRAPLLSLFESIYSRDLRSGLARFDAVRGATPKDRESRRASPINRRPRKSTTFLAWTKEQSGKETRSTRFELRETGGKLETGIARYRTDNDRKLKNKTRREKEKRREGKGCCWDLRSSIHRRKIVASGIDVGRYPLARGLS